MPVFYKSFTNFTNDHLGILQVSWENKGNLISPFSASDVLSYKICLGQDKVVKFSMVTKEELIMTPILISYPGSSGKKTYKSF